LLRKTVLCTRISGASFFNQNLIFSSALTHRLRRVDELIPVLWEKLDGVVMGSSRQRTDAFEQRSSIPAPGPLRVYTTVCFLVDQLNARQLPFVAFSNVPHCGN
jgi:hypothetical protein